MATAAAAAVRLAARLRETETRIVFAESCSGGLAAATLAAIPGISNWFCGSAVTYRESAKIHWLGVSPTDLQQWTAVSEVIARQMAAGVLGRTSEAELAFSITGHLGPGAPAEFDGIVFIGCAERREDGRINDHAGRWMLEESDRTARQIEAARLLLQRAYDALSHR